MVRRDLTQNDQCTFRLRAHSCVLGLVGTQGGGNWWGVWWWESEVREVPSACPEGSSESEWFQKEQVVVLVLDSKSTSGSKKFMVFRQLTNGSKQYDKHFLS